MNLFTKYFKKLFSEKRVIFIVEDNEVYSKALKTFIERNIPNIKEVKCFGIGEMCLTEMHRKPDIVIVDYFLNSQFTVAYDGLEIIKRIKAQNMQTKIIVLSSQEKFSVIREVIREYDCFYVQKDDNAFSYVKSLINEILDPKISSDFSTRDQNIESRIKKHIVSNSFVKK